ncbi:MAG UNVERIFIED_CONTAM: substrate-binding domain-containing protein [Anaerolineae bacterium]
MLLDNVSDERYPSVYIDHLNGVKSAIQHLLRMGHARIGCIPYGPLASMGNRVDTVREALRKGGHPLENRYIRFGEFDPESGYQAMQSLLRESPRVTAVFGMNDMMALGAMRAILDAGLRIPQDVAVIGYDNMRFSPFTNPTLTTIHAPELEQGQLAGKMLVELIHGKVPQTMQIALSTRMIQGRSC